MTEPLPTSVFESSFADQPDLAKTITMPLAQQIFDYFKTATLFRWSDANNDCEDRANAICILLDEWKIPNYKGWVLSGYFLRRNLGSLLNNWNYHVAALLPVQTDNKVEYYIIDPATSTKLETIERWASKITGDACSYHFIKHGSYYIFPSTKIAQDNWYKRNRRNHRWTMQGLSGINGVSIKGKAQLAFNKQRVKRTEEQFSKLKYQPPEFLMAHARHMGLLMR